MPRCVGIGLTVALCASAACGTAAHKLAYGPQELRDELRRRAPDLPPDELVVPFEVSREDVERARGAVRTAVTDEQRIRLLSEALMARHGFGLRYAPTVTATAAETLRRKEGNCLALASAFIGLARALGLDAVYIDASVKVHSTRFETDGTAVNEGHVTAMVRTARGNIGLDFSRLRTILGYRVLDDVEALAHFYNNRGFELMERAEALGTPVDWRVVEGDFRRAVAVLPPFARAWNNLGVVAARLGRTDEAVASYRAAAERDPELAAPHNNLGRLLLARGDVAGAVKELEAAARLEPAGSHIQYNLALALLRAGDRDGARDALRRTVELRADDAEALALLDELGPAPEDHGRRPRRAREPDWQTRPPSREQPELMH